MGASLIVQYSSPDSFRMNKSRKMKWTGNMTGMGDRRGDSGFHWGDLRERANLEDFGLDGMKFHSEDLHCLYSLRNVVREIR